MPQSVVSEHRHPRTPLLPIFGSAPWLLLALSVSCGCSSEAGPAADGGSSGGFGGSSTGTKSVGQAVQPSAGTGASASRVHTSNKPKSSAGQAGVGAVPGWTVSSSSGAGAETAGSSGSTSTAGSPSGGGEGGSSTAGHRSRPFACAASKSPLFASAEPIEMRITADFTKLNTAPTAEESASTATVEVGGAQPATLTANIQARGNSRFRWCQVRPFSLKFSEKQQGNIFEHLGKTVKFVSHCVGKDNAPADTYKADSPDVYEQRVVKEHSAYQVLDQLGVPSLKTRLVRLVYHDALTGAEDTHYSIALEPEDEMAKRCGMAKRKDANLPEGAATPLNQYGNVLINLLNNFLLQYDWSISPQKNVIELIEPTARETFFAPYDFDLVAVSRPDYGPNEQRTLETSRVAFADWLRRNTSAPLFEEAKQILERADAIRSVINRPELDAKSHELFSQWFDQFSMALGEYRSCEGHAEDADRTACYVPDDHGNLRVSASPVSLGEWTTRIEPPGDVDWFAVRLESGALYTMGGRTELELSDESGVRILDAAANAPVSFRAPRAASFYLRASQGASLVVSPLYPSSDDLDLNTYLYADDVGASLETAMTLEPRVSWKGLWELSHGEDQDWYRVHLDPGVSLKVVLPFLDWAQGFVEMTRLDGGADPESSSADLSRGDNDLSEFVTVSGDYLVKLIQVSGTGESVPYEIQIE
ncbi:MAG TPA: hypothetical protein VKP30_14525 [Polyangiaceae bacterium]|nr:hypothetical protein [Polyangiaceae bacterium]